MKEIRSSLCACCTPAVLRFSRIIWVNDWFAAVFGAGFLQGVDQFVVLIHPKHAMRRETFDRERPRHADCLLILVGLVVKVFKLGLGGDRGVDLLLAGHSRLPPVGVQLCWGFGPRISGAFGKGLQRVGAL